MTVISISMNPVNIVQGAKRRSASGQMPNSTKEMRVRMTSNGSWDAASGQGSIVEWGIEVDPPGGTPRYEKISIANIPFGWHTPRGGEMPYFTIPTPDLVDMNGAQCNLFIQTTGPTIQLGATIDLTDTVGEIIPQ